MQIARRRVRAGRVARHQGKRLPVQMGDKVDLSIDTIKEEIDVRGEAFRAAM